MNTSPWNKDRLVSLIEFIQVDRDTLLNSFDVAFCLLRCEIVRFAVHCLELAAVYGNNHISEYLHLTTQVNKCPTGIFNTFAVVFSEVRNGFKIRR